MSEFDDELELGEQEVEGREFSPNRENEPSIPKHRFDQVNNRYRETKQNLDIYSKFGTPQEIEAKLARIREQEERDDPTMARINEVYEYVARDRNRQTQARTNFIDQAEGKFASYAKELGLPEDDQTTLYDLQAQVAEQIRRNPKLMARFNNNDMSAIDEAYKLSSEKGLIAMLRRSKQGKLYSTKTNGPRQPTSPRAQGSNQIRQEPVRKTEREMLEQAAESGFSVLMSKSED